MMEPIGTGTVVTGLRLIAEGSKWLWRSRQAPWSVVNLQNNRFRIWTHPRMHITVRASKVHAHRPNCSGIQKPVWVRTNSVHLA